MKQTQNWSKSWKSSTDPQKQRKYRQNAPQHVKDNFISANLSHSLRDELGTRNLGIRNGDRVKVMRGDRKGAEGIVNKIDRENERVYIDGVEKESVDGSKHQLPIRPSNVQIVSLNLSEEDRLEKYEISDFESIKVDDEEVEEALEEDEEEEMMQQMQGGESGAHEQFEDMDEEEIEEVKEEIEEEIDEEELAEEAEESSEEEESEESEETEETEAEESEEEETSVDYSDVVSGTISDAKDQISEMESPDFDALLEAEKSNKDRKTMVEYLENQKEDE
jgi:large subunit ribosomal protein L24